MSRIRRRVVHLAFPLSWGLSLWCCACGARVEPDGPRLASASGVSAPSAATGALSPQLVPTATGETDLLPTASEPAPTVYPWEPIPADAPTEKYEEFVVGLRAEAPAVDPNVLARPTNYLPPLPRLTLPGWRDSVETFCDVQPPPFTRSIVRRTTLWADLDGVAALSFSAAGSDLRYNNGTGWRWLMGHTSESFSLLAGYPRGSRLIVGGAIVVDVNLDGSLGASAERTSGWPHVIQGIDHGHAVALFQGCGRGGCGVESVFYKNPSGWLKGASPGARLGAIWANNDVFYIPNTKVSRITTSPEMQALNLPDEQTPTAIVGVLPNSLWVFTQSASVLRWLNYEWIPIGTLDEAATHAFSDGLGAYYITPHTFGRVGDSISLIAELDPTGTVTFEAISGQSDEVYLSLHDTSLAAYACGTELLVRYQSDKFALF
jgi:hypothetical protein